MFPLVTDCPLCGAVGKLEVRGEADLRCRECWFVGDPVELYNTARHEPIESSVTKLVGAGLFTVERPLQYGEAAQARKITKDWLWLRAKVMREGPSGAQLGILDRLGIRPDRSVYRALYPHVISFTRQAIEEAKLPVAKASLPSLRSMGRYSYVGVPAWNGSEPVGLFGIGANQTVYISFDNGGKPGTGFGLVPSVCDGWAVVCQDIVHALRATVWSCIDTGSPKGFVVPFGLQDYPDTYRTRRTIYWSPGNEGPWILRALEQPGSLAIPGNLFGTFDPHTHHPTDTFATFEDLLVQNAKPAHLALVDHVGSLDDDQANQLLRGKTLDPEHQSRILGAARSPDELDRLKGLLDTNTIPRTIMWDGATVLATSDGWFEGGSLVSNAIITITHIRPIPAEGDAEVLGSVQIGSRHAQFSERLTTVQLKTYSWLYGFCISRLGVPLRVSERWKRKLFDVACQFHNPETLEPHNTAGWHDRTLVLPNFSVDSRGVHRTTRLVKGPQIRWPDSPSGSTLEQWNTRSFGELVLPLLGNLLRTLQGHRAKGILVAQSPHLIDRMAAALAQPLTHELTAGEPLEPLPIWIDPSVPVRPFLESGRYVGAAVTNVTAQVSTLLDRWVVVNPAGQVDYGAIQSLFWFLPALIDSGIESGQNGLYRAIADRLVRSGLDAPRLLSVGKQLDEQADRSAGTRVLMVLRWAVANRLIELDDGESVVIDRQALNRLGTQSDLPAPPTDQLIEWLRGSAYVGTVTNRTIEIPRLIWDLHGSLVG